MSEEITNKKKVALSARAVDKMKIGNLDKSDIGEYIGLRVTCGKKGKSAAFNGFQAEYVVGSVVDVGVSMGVNGLSSAPLDAPDRSWGFAVPWMGKYTGISVNFKGGNFDGLDIGLGLGRSSPVTYTMPLKTFLNNGYRKTPIVNPEKRR